MRKHTTITIVLRLRDGEIWLVVALPFSFISAHNARQQQCLFVTLFIVAFNQKLWDWIFYVYCTYTKAEKSLEG